MLFQNFRECVAEFGLLTCECVLKNDMHFECQYNELTKCQRVPLQGYVLLTERMFYMPLCGLPLLYFVQ